MALTKDHKPALMNPLAARAWIRHLKSGAYPETPKGRPHLLRTINNEFSALGVLCNIYAQCNPTAVINERWPHFFMGLQFELPRRVMDWVDMGSTDLSQVVSTTTGKTLKKETGHYRLFDLSKALGHSAFAEFLEEHVATGNIGTNHTNELYWVTA